jgi:hypothetical protein
MSAVGQPGLNQELESALDTFHTAVEEIKMLRLAQGRKLEPIGVASIAGPNTKEPEPASYSKPEPTRPINAGSFRSATILAGFATLLICLPGALIEEHATKGGSQTSQVAVGVHSHSIVPAPERRDAVLGWPADEERRRTGAPKEDGAAPADASFGPIDDAAINLLLASLARQQGAEQPAAERWLVDANTSGGGLFPLTSEAPFPILPGGERLIAGAIETSAGFAEAEDPPSPLPVGGSSTDIS